MGSIAALLGEFLPYIIAAGTAVAALLGYGYQQRRAGKAEVREQHRVADLEEANKVRKKVTDALDDTRDVPAIERLRGQGRLRD